MADMIQSVERDLEVGFPALHNGRDVDHVPRRSRLRLPPACTPRSSGLALHQAALGALAIYGALPRLIRTHRREVEAVHPGRHTRPLRDRLSDTDDSP